MKIGILSLGCARTLVDSEVALGSLAGAGHEIVPDLDRADIALVNTCGFIEEAKAESIQAILELCERKKSGRLKAVVVLGCLAQRYGEELRKELKNVDAILGVDDYAKLAEALKPLSRKEKIFRVSPKPHFLADETSPRIALTPRHLAYIKISEGCINACSYCVIPRMKGAHRSRTIESVVEEIRRLSAERTLSEINLIGQDTAAFGYDRVKRFELPELLREAAAATAVPWIRLLYAHPGHVTEELLEAMASHSNICRYVDFPIEHSHDAMLKRMNRGVDRQKMEWGIRQIRKRLPGASIRTTVIVGFPGETEEEFQDLLDFLAEHRFDRLGAFEFSREENSRAWNLPDQIPKKIKEERFRRVMELQREISLEKNQAWIGRRIRVLVDERDPEESDAYLGRTEGDAPEVDGQVLFRSERSLSPGQFVDVLVTDALEYDLVGEEALPVPGKEPR